MSDRILATLKSEDKSLDVNFFVKVTYEYLPKSCDRYKVIEHGDFEYRMVPVNSCAARVDCMNMRKGGVRPANVFKEQQDSNVAGMDTGATSQGLA